MLNTGDFVFDTIEKANVQVLEKIEAWGYVSYKAVSYTHLTLPTT